MAHAATYRAQHPPAPPALESEGAARPPPRPRPRPPRPPSPAASPEGRCCRARLRVSGPLVRRRRARSAAAARWFASAVFRVVAASIESNSNARASAACTRASASLRAATAASSSRRIRFNSSFSAPRPGSSRRSSLRVMPLRRRSPQRSLPRCLPSCLPPASPPAAAAPAAAAVAVAAAASPPSAHRRGGEAATLGSSFAARGRGRGPAAPRAGGARAERRLRATCCGRGAIA